MQIPETIEQILPPAVTGVIQSFLAIYIVVNPSGVASVFLGLTKGMERSRQRSIGFRAALAGGLVLILFALAGTYLFQLFKITGASLQIAGSMFVIGFAFALARGKENEFFGALDDQTKHAAPASLAYFPLAVPLIAGPASITVVMTLSAKNSDPVGRTVLLATIGAVAFMTFLSMGRMMKLTDRFGPGISLIMPRVMALILAVIAIQLMIDGIAQVLPSLALIVRDALANTPPGSAG